MLEKMVSKKLGVAVSSGILLAWISSNSPEYASQITWQITAITIVYLLIQGANNFWYRNKTKSKRNSRSVCYCWRLLRSGDNLSTAPIPSASRPAPRGRRQLPWRLRIQPRRYGPMSIIPVTAPPTMSRYRQRWTHCPLKAVRSGAQRGLIC